VEIDIRESELMKAFKYLGVEENHNIEHKNEKEKLKKEYVRRLRLIFNTKLSAKNKMQAIGTLAVPVHAKFKYVSFNLCKQKLA